MTAVLIRLLAALRAGKRLPTAAGPCLSFAPADTRELDDAVVELEACMTAEMARGHLQPPPPPGALQQGNADLVDPAPTTRAWQAQQAGERG